MAEPFIGEIRAFPYIFAPSYWGRCDGQVIPINQNPSLYSILGTTFGGDGRTDFGVPNLKDRTPMHPGTGPGLTPRRWGEYSGAPQASFNQAAMPKHGHGANAAYKRNPDYNDPANDRLPHKLVEDTQTQQSARIYRQPTGTETLVNMDYHMVSSVGSALPHENRQPFLGLYFCIALLGVYPSRS